MKYFLLYLVVAILQLVHEISIFPEVLYKIGDPKNFSNLQENTRSSHPEMFYKKNVLKIFGRFTEKRLCWSVFFDKAAGWKPLTVRRDHWRYSPKKVFLKRRVGVSKAAINRSSFQNRCFWLIHKIHSVKPVSECLFNKVVVLRAYNFIKEDSNTSVFLWNL